MREADLKPFTEMLDATCSLLSRGTYQPNATATAMFFRALASYPLAEVRAAFDAHIRDRDTGRFVPTPSHILAQLRDLASADGRPGADEAWAIALRAGDEMATVVWTTEMREAWFIALPVLQGGDEVGARIAFRQAYERKTEEARTQRQPARWHASVGQDFEAAALELRLARERGLLTDADLVDTPAALPAPTADPAVLALPAPVRNDPMSRLMHGAPPQFRKRWEEVRAGLEVEKPTKKAQRAAADREFTAAAKDRAAQLYQERTSHVSK
jgi:hypothetical protein